jgi:hypothetical protein
VLNRGGDELKILYFLERLKRQAARTGGTVITMNRNHEILNAEEILNSKCRRNLF